MIHIIFNCSMYTMTPSVSRTSTWEIPYSQLAPPIQTILVLDLMASRAEFPVALLLLFLLPLCPLADEDGEGRLYCIIGAGPGGKKQRPAGPMRFHIKISHRSNIRFCTYCNLWLQISTAAVQCNMDTMCSIHGYNTSKAF